jgi:hypothetical protein
MSPSRSATAQTPPDSPSSSPAPTPSPATSSSSLFAPIPSSPPSSSETDASPSQPPAQDEASWSTAAPADPYSAPDAPSDTPSTGSDLRVSKAGLRAAVGSGFRSVCRVVAAFVADEEERQLGVWAPDEDDVQDVARPATNIVYRRLPDEARGGDVIDLMALALALAGYVGKSLSRRAQVRTIRNLQAQQGIDVPGEGATP